MKISKELYKTEKIINQNYWTNYLGFSRTLLAFSLMITLLFNDKLTLFYTGLQNENYPKFDNYELNIYSWFADYDSGIILSLLILIPVIIGIYPKYTCILHWLVTYSFNITSSCIDGGDQVASIITLLLIPICIFDNRKWHWSIEKSEKNFYVKTIATSFYHLICLQIFVVYFFSSIGKFENEQWRNGTAIYYWLTQPLFGCTDVFKPFLNIILYSPLCTTLSNWFVLLLELFIAFSIFVCNIKFKKGILILGILFHFSIALFLGIVSFSITMVASLLLFLISKNNNYGYRSQHFNSFIYRFRNFISFSTKKNKSFLRLQD
jgi:antimicrobial peptide system SdpB family protein